MKFQIGLLAGIGVGAAGGVVLGFIWGIAHMLRFAANVERGKR